MTLAGWDYVVVILYFILILYTGFIVASRREKKSDSREDFLLAGRRLTLPFFVASLVATWYGSILGIGEFVYRDGLLAWVCFGLPYYIAAGFFAAFIAKRVRRSGSITIPEQITKHFGKNAGLVSSIIILIITIPASYVLMLGVIIELFTGWQLYLCVIAGAVLSLAFLFKGGFNADVLTNTVQFVLMYVGFIVIVIFSFLMLGGLPEMVQKLPETHLNLTGTANWQYVFAWYIIAFQTFIDPSFHQRCAAAKTPQIARRGIIISIVCWMVFDSLTLLAGLYARAYCSIDNPVMAYPALAEAVLPVAVKGLFVVAMLSVIMSTLDSYVFISGATIGNDLFPNMRFFKNKNTSPQKLTRIGLFVASVLAIAGALAIPSVIDLIYKTSSIAVPALIVPLTITYSKRLTIKSGHAMLIMIITATVAALWTLLKILIKNGFMDTIPVIADMEPMAPAIIISFVLMLFFVKHKSNYNNR